MKTYKIRRVLVPIDFGVISANALKTALAICQRQFATLTLIHVVENSYLQFTAEAGAAASAMLPELVDIAEENLNNLAKELRTQHDVVVNHIVQSGKLSDQICIWASLHKIDLIVMGATSKTGISKLMGSTAFRVVRHAPCPVMTIPKTDEIIEFHKILFPIRVIPGALEKYDALEPIIKRNLSSLVIAGIVKKEDAGTLVEMKDLVDTIRNKVTSIDIMCSSEVHYCEDVAQQVLEIANEHQPDLIVITASLDSTWRELFPGTYTQRIINDAQFPVLSIRPDVSEDYADFRSMLAGNLQSEITH